MHIPIMVTDFSFLLYLGLVKDLYCSEYNGANRMSLTCYTWLESPSLGQDYTRLKELISLCRCSGVQNDSFFILRPFKIAIVVQGLCSWLLGPTPPMALLTLEKQPSHHREVLRI